MVTLSSPRLMKANRKPIPAARIQISKAYEYQHPDAALSEKREMIH